MYHTRAPISEEWPAESAGPVSSRLPRKHEALLKRVAATIGFLADASRRRRSGRMALWVVVVALAVAGVGMLSYPTYTHYYAHRQQGKLAKEFAQIKAGPASIEGDRKREIKIGEALTRLRSPRLGWSVVVVVVVTG